MCLFWLHAVSSHGHFQRVLHFNIVLYRSSNVRLVILPFCFSLPLSPSRVTLEARACDGCLSNTAFIIIIIIRVSDIDYG